MNTLAQLLIISSVALGACTNTTSPLPVSDKAAQGLAGDAGAVGATGATGPAGATGATGAQGPQGIPGTASAIGATGATGAQGPQGPAGPQGAGLPGAPGAQGPAGATGAPGPAGAAGAKGAAGPQGPQGAAGAAGAQGPAGATWTKSLVYTTTATLVISPALPGAAIVSGLVASCSDASDILLAGGCNGYTNGAATGANPGNFPAFLGMNTFHPSDATAAAGYECLFNNASTTQSATVSATATCVAVP